MKFRTNTYTVVHRIVAKRNLLLATHLLICQLLAVSPGASAQEQGTNSSTAPQAQTEDSSTGLQRVRWRAVPASTKSPPRAEPPTVKPARAEGVSTAQFQDVEPTSIEPTYNFEEYGCDAIGCETKCECDSCRRARGGSVDLWFRGEFLLWSLEGSRVPALVTTSPAGTLPRNTGVLGFAATQTLFGDDRINEDFRPGGRFTLGLWRDSGKSIGYEASYMRLARSSDDFSASSTNFPYLARPVFDNGLGTQSSMLVAHPDFLTGSINVHSFTEYQAFDLIRRQCLYSTRGQRSEIILGYRHGRLDDSIRIDQASLYTAPQGQIISGTTVSLFDQFNAENRFDGAQVGIETQKRYGLWTLDTMAKIGFGLNHSEVFINGSTTNTVPNNGSATFAGGLLAQTTNIGDYDRNSFIAIPEAGATLTSRINRNLEFSLGYRVLYWTKVVRAGDQIDSTVSQFPPEPPSGSQNPRLQFVTDGFVAHGLQVGLLYEY